MTTGAESICREFAAQFPTPNVLEAVRLAESGQLLWTDIELVFIRALSDGLAAVKGGE